MKVTWKKLSKNKRTMVWIAAALALTALCFLMSPYIERLMLKAVAVKLPEVARIYQAEQAQFPSYTIGVMKRWTKTDIGKTVSYRVTLKSGADISKDKLLHAGQIACNTGLPKDIYVSVTGTRQYYLLPIYVSKTIRGQCPEFSGA